MLLIIMPDVIVLMLMVHAGMPPTSCCLHAEEPSRAFGDPRASKCVHMCV